MNKLIFLLILFVSGFSHSQNDSPYETDLVKDGLWITAGVGFTITGVLLIQDNPYLTEAELAELSEEDIFFMDRWIAGNYSTSSDALSNIPFYGSFAIPPIIMLLNANEKHHVGQISVLFVEAMATTGAMFAMTAGIVRRARPMVYNENVSLEERLAGKSQRSFFGGHTAATATATFFAAKVFHDFNPDSWAVPYFYAGAALVPAFVGYLRQKAGKHFLTDNLVGYAVGMASGILIPELHKKENPDFSLVPFFGKNYKGLSFSYTF